jgi:hypothetical protein
MNVTNEMGVIVEFAKRSESMGWEIVSIQAGFPDVTIKNIKTGEIVRAEIEYNSSSFYAHKHDPAKCDLIICWVHDWKECVMPVWELSITVFGNNVVVPKMDNKDRKIMSLLVDNYYWKNKAREYQPVSVKTPIRYPHACGVDGCTYTIKNAQSVGGHMKAKHPAALGIFEPVTKEQVKQ